MTTYVEALRTRWTREATFTGILSGFKGSTPEQFFQTGEEAVAEVLRRAEDFGQQRFKRALDFGCGMGRLTRALADRFEHVVGLDVSPRMIELAKRYDSRPEYLLTDELPPAVKPVDFLLSLYVLQHSPPEKAAWYLGQFPLWLSKGGIAAVQTSIPSEDGGLQDADARRVLGDKLLAVDTQESPAFPGVVSHTYWFRG